MSSVKHRQYKNIKEGQHVIKISYCHVPTILTTQHQTDHILLICLRELTPSHSSETCDFTNKTSVRLRLYQQHTTHSLSHRQVVETDKLVSSVTQSSPVGSVSLLSFSRYLLFVCVGSPNSSSSWSPHTRTYTTRPHPLFQI